MKPAEKQEINKEKHD